MRYRDPMYTQTFPDRKKNDSDGARCRTAGSRTETRSLELESDRRRQSLRRASLLRLEPIVCPVWPAIHDRLLDHFVDPDVHGRANGNTSISRLGGVCDYGFAFFYSWPVRDRRLFARLRVQLETGISVHLATIGSIRERGMIEDVVRIKSGII